MIGLVTEPGRIGRAWYFRLQREFDRTGTFLLGQGRQLGWYDDDFTAQGKAIPAQFPAGVMSEPLTPDTPYTVRTATLTIDDPTPNDAAMPDWKLHDRLPDIDNIKEELLKSIRTRMRSHLPTFPASAAVGDRLSFLLGRAAIPACCGRSRRRTASSGRCGKHFETGQPRRCRAFHPDVRRPDLCRHAEPH